ncbi:tRNA uridine-5-carboxymethylaminomethyl(34) synthesis GTPase MnmE [bacterium]|nr:tRNA uridine-5-carboxymethylaminomethyl(34) synthesis GTPase MnmE [bacterium]
MNNDTIFALSSGHGKSGVAVIRVAGDNLHDLFAEMSGRDAFDARRAYMVNFRDGDDLIDQCVMIYFAAPHSFTGTDVIEIQTHGAPAVIERVFDYLRARGARLASPGEFSRRAFDHGKMDLADVDALAALLDATTDRQRRAALHAMTGDGAQYGAWRHDMLEIAAYAAAILDYADDELPPNIGDTVRERTRKLYDEITAALNRYAAVRAVRVGFNIALVGDTNVGKSSLFNQILGSNRAIVSDVPGTTRDVVDAALDMDGYLVNLFDTAGIRETADTIEQMGIDRTRETARHADLILRVTTDDAAPAPAPNEILIINKSDVSGARTRRDALYTSATTGDGIAALMDAIRARLHTMLDGAEDQLTINTRTHDLLRDAADNLGAAMDAGDNFDIMAEHVRRAADAIGKILGAITAADVMDAAFSQLCLGK